jgi:GNAT superfamily N-acetyltransferase
VVEIRRAGAADAEAVGRIHARSRAAAYAGLVPADALALVTPRTQEIVWRQRLSSVEESWALLVAELADDAVGFAFGTGHGGPRTSRAELNAIHVVPEQQGSGAGQVLHDVLFDDFAGWGCREATLWVLRGNERAQSFYRRNGWRHDGTTSQHQVGGADVPILKYVRAL